MSLGWRRCERQDTFWVVTEKFGNGPRNVFFDRLNRLLAEIDFDAVSIGNGNSVSVL